MEIPLNPKGPKVCTCRYLWGAHPQNPEFVCENPIDGEDGLCTGCRESRMCSEERESLAAQVNSK